LKKGLETEEGIMGINCYCRRIGFPKIKSTSISIRKLPVEFFEGIAEEFIKKLESCDMEQLIIKTLIPKDCELKYPIRIQSFFHFQYYPETDNEERGRWIRDGFVCDIGKIARELGFGWDISSRLKETNTMNKYYHSQCEIFKNNSCGLQSEEFYQKYRI